MWDHIEERVRANAAYIIKTGCTVRACSAYMHVSKSTVHTVVTK